VKENTKAKKGRSRGGQPKPILGRGNNFPKRTRIQEQKGLAMVSAGRQSGEGKGKNKRKGGGKVQVRWSKTMDRQKVFFRGCLEKNIQGKELHEAGGRRRRRAREKLGRESPTCKQSLCKDQRQARIHPGALTRRKQ